MHARAHTHILNVRFFLTNVHSNVEAEAQIFLLPGYWVWGYRACRCAFITHLTADCCSVPVHETLYCFTFMCTPKLYQFFLNVFEFLKIQKRWSVTAASRFFIFISLPFFCHMSWEMTVPFAHIKILIAWFCLVCWFVLPCLQKLLCCCRSSCSAVKL